MWARSWSWPARHPVISFLAITALPAAALFWLSWRSLEQERLWETQRLQKHLEQAADLAVTSLQQILAEVERSQGEPLAAASEEALAVTFAEGRLATRPGNRLLYYPVLPAVPEIPQGVFSRGQDLENRGDYAGAAAAFRETSQSDSARVRAGALLRMARNLKKAGQPEMAVAGWTELEKAGPLPLDGGLNGVPADLVARRARYALLVDLKRLAEAQQQAEVLASDLNSGRWQLDRATYLHYMSEIDRKPPEARAALADAVEWLWNKRRTTPSGRETAVIRGRPFTMIWRGQYAVAATPGYVAKAWLQPLTPLLKNQGVLLSLDPRSSSGVQRMAAATGLPWDLRVFIADPEADSRQLASRQRFLLAMVGLLGVLLCAGTYAIARGVNRELAAARLQSDFVSAVSHEFRTPLTSLQQINEALTDGRAPETQRQSFLEAQGRATERLGRLVESLLDFGRMEAGAKLYRLQSTNATELLQQVTGEFQRERGGGCDVELSIEEPALRVSADPDALTHAIWNLLDNAAKYSPQCRTVWVKASRRNGSVAISVRDQGLGIPRNEHKAIFAKFVRGAAAQFNGITGAGIGLSMVAHIVEAHGGRIDVESAPGAGSTFTILLPADG